ncbi:MAG: ferrous iron transport protein B [Candidatus Obscuribacterales bacterium]|nr:ferrous iron transport protein B [Candidatus Obscuribacterales bacterium]
MASDAQQRPTATTAQTPRKLVLAGNPNVGKSALFNALTGLNADVSNYPGTTIDIARGKLGDDLLSDTPGVYGVSSFNDEERIAKRMILEAEAVINVVSALSLDRDLFLTLQLIDMQKPLIVVLNQWDEAEQRGVRIDTVELSKILGVPVMTAVAVEKKGLSEIKESVDKAAIGNQSQVLQVLIGDLVKKNVPAQTALLSMEGDAECAQSFEIAVESKRAEIYKMRRQRVNEITEKVVVQEARRKRISARIGRLLLHPVYGSIVSLTVCYLIFYQLLGVIVAGSVVDITEKQCMRVYYEPTVRRACASVFPCKITVSGQAFEFPGGMNAAPALVAKLERAARGVNPAQIKFDFWNWRNLASVVGNLLCGEYGVLTLTVTYLLGLLMPLVIAFYFGLSLMEDSGYLPRLAVLVDRLLNKIGLTGRAIIPLILGLGCVTMATVTTRLLSTNREKIIATALLGIAIPCSAQLGIVSGTLAKAGGLLPWILYCSLVGLILAVTGLVLNKLMPGKSGALMIDLPPMRFPRPDNVLKKTWSKSFNFMLESIPMFCLAGLVVSVGQMTGMLDWFVRSLQPMTVGLLQLPNDERIATTFILGIVRRDFAAFGLTDVALSQTQAVVAMIVITLFVPCIATVGVMIKERGFAIAMSIWAGSWLFAFLVGGALARVLPSLFQAVSF